jgi:NurA-like 5'-3' nuclease
MLHEIYLDAIKNREAKIASISTDLNKKILEKAHTIWKGYEPRPKEDVVVGVDSSYNSRPFQGFHVYAVDAVCVRVDGSMVSARQENKAGVIDQGQLETKSMQMETEVAAEAANISDLVLVDGSIIARFVMGTGSVIKSVIDLTDNNQNVVFVAKTSDSREIFASMNSRVGDIYYFNRISKKAGYSRPHYITQYEEKYARRITVVFTRLSEYTPIIKLEFAGEVDEDYVKGTIDQIAFKSVAGYPYVLKIAHKTAVITDNDIERLVSIYGLKNEIGAREVLM